MNRFKNILFVADPATDNAPALRQAFTLCRNNQASLTIVSVVPEIIVPGRPVLAKDVLDERTDWLSAMLDDIDAHQVNVALKVLSGRDFFAIISQVLKFNHDLLIKPSQRHPGVISRVHDIVDKKLLRKCPCPLWLITSMQQQGGLEFVVALDYEPENPENEPLNRQLLEMAASLSVSEFAEWHIVHAWQLEHEGILRSPRLGLTRKEVDEMVTQEERRRHQGLTRLIEHCCSAHGRSAEKFLMPNLHLINGQPQKVVPDLVEKLGAELLIMGTVARTGIPGLLIGNTAEAILDQVDCSILTVKPEGFVSPVKVS